MKTQAYYNLHRHLFSLRKSGKVFLHTDNAVFEKCKVSCTESRSTESKGRKA